ncbi:hypothetical protein MKX01_001432 [Papaver californicum]|nr:hypothetical protein MKX01_001432 [Papaver californicum]
MPSFPPPGSVTICEINRDLITADQISEEGAKDTYGKVLGVVFNPIQFEPDNLLPNIEQTNNDEDNRAKKDPFSFLSKILFPPADVKLLGEIDLQGVSWHQHKILLAFISGSNQITVCDYEDSDGKDPYILTNESQKDVRVLDWRPNGGKTLAVACQKGICIWSASYPGSVACVRSGIASFAGTLSRASGVRWTMVDFLRSSNNEQISALSWSLGTPIRRGLGGISLLQWSPMGDYFFTAKFDGTFYLWETNTWTSETWSSTGGFVTGATWDPDGHMILLAFSESVALGSIHFASKPPSLDAHLLPVELPEVGSLINSKGIEKISWDASGERLAVSYKGGDEKYLGLIAIYDVRRSPLITASLIGFVRGPGESPKPLASSFHDKFKQGPLLSVCWSSGWCCTYPLIFR